MKFKNLEDKCQYYRGLTDYKLLPNTPILVMLDGKNFSTMIKNNFKKPFDDDFIEMMNKTAKFLCNNVQGVKFAYTQSDEISLLITDYDTPETDTAFGGRLCKLQSIIASMATAEFNRQFVLDKLSKKVDDTDIVFAEVYDTINTMKLCNFDCKVWPVPNENEAFAWFLYRQLDCIKNSKQQTAQTYLPHKVLVGKDADTQIEMVKAYNGMDWNAFNPKYKYGRFVYKVETEGTATNKKTGEVTTFIRNKFTVTPAYELTDTENKVKFMNTCFNHD